MSDLVVVGKLIYSLNKAEVVAASNFFQAEGKTYQVLEWEGKWPSIREVSLSFIWSSLPVLRTFKLKGSHGQHYLLRWMGEVYEFPQKYTVAILMVDEINRIGVQVEWPKEERERIFPDKFWMFTITDLPRALPRAVKI